LFLIFILISLNFSFLQKPKGGKTMARKNVKAQEQVQTQAPQQVQTQAPQQVQTQAPQQVQTQAPQQVQTQAPQFDFSKGIDDLAAQLENFQPHKRLHVIRSYLKFRRIHASSYEIECMISGCPNLVIRFLYDGSYSFILSFRTGNGDLSRAAVIFDTRELPEDLAEVVYYATLGLIYFIESDCSLHALAECRQKGYIIRRALKRQESPDAPPFKEYFKLFK
jgi:hypothetical protein